MITSERIDLVWLGTEESAPAWKLGTVTVVAATPAALSRTLSSYRIASMAALLLWDANLGAPNEATIYRALTTPGDVWHAGLRLGMGGMPAMLDYVAPTWMLNRDPDPLIEATSWRLSLRACLIRSEVLSQLGGPHSEFATLAGAGLELGHRYITRGALVRYMPWLLPAGYTTNPPSLPIDDELRFMFYQKGRFWSGWAVMRAALAKEVSPLRLFTTWQRLKSVQAPQPPMPLVRHEMNTASAELGAAQVSVLIPTLDRYSYLRTLIDQLRTQTVRPLEIIIVDQTPFKRRDLSLADDFADLPLRIMYRDQAGQCSSRNAGLQAAQGEYVLFIDDDDEVGPDLIEAHLKNLWARRAEVSSGVAYEVGAGPLPANFTYTRASDVFPTNNTLIRAAALRRSGLFDLAYERGQRADGDLGLRLYLSGALMVLNAEIGVLHHHAPAGGLRAHRVRIITYASSRRSLWQRHLPSVSELYLARRYFSPRQVREALLLRVFGTLSVRGPRWRRGMKLVAGVLLMPDTWCQIRSRQREAADMLQTYPQIPTLTDTLENLSSESRKLATNEP